VPSGPGGRAPALPGGAGAGTGRARQHPLRHHPGQHRGAGRAAIDLPISENADPKSLHPFKGDIDLAGLRQKLEEAGAGRVAFVVLTLTDNSGGGQPVSLANVRAAAGLCRQHRVPLLLDAARIARTAT